MPGQGFGLAFDGEGNLFTTVNYAVDPSEIWKFAPDGTSSVFVTATDVVSGWGDLAFDRFGNLFTSTDVCPSYAPIRSSNLLLMVKKATLPRASPNLEGWHLIEAVTSLSPTAHLSRPVIS